MGLYGAYDSQNIFAKIICDEAPCYKIREDEDVPAFPDLFPQSYGHTLVTLRHAEAHSLLKTGAQNLAKVMAVVQCLTRALVKEVQPDGVQVAQLNGVFAGQTVFHIHFYVIPRSSDKNLGIHTVEQGGPKVFA